MTSSLVRLVRVQINIRVDFIKQNILNFKFMQFYNNFCPKMFVEFLNNKIRNII